MKRWMLAAILGVGLLAAALLAGPPDAGASWAPFEKTPVEEDGDPEDPSFTIPDSADEDSRVESVTPGQILQSVVTTCFIEVLGL